LRVHCRAHPGAIEARCGFPFTGAFPINETDSARRALARASAVESRCGGRMSNTIFVLNGPNLNLLGTREPEIYGRSTLADVEKLCRATAQRFGLTVEFRQSNHEGEIIDWIQQARAEKAAGLILNPAGFTTTSIAILDALFTMEAPVIEVHITNIHKRESFRQHSYVSLAARAVVCGFGIEGYALAISGVASMISAKG
jgi:3-dehydroquinate dehydratase-2